jgi:hypothetical protein
MHIDVVGGVHPITSVANVLNVSAHGYSSSSGLENARLHAPGAPFCAKCGVLDLDVSREASSRSHDQRQVTVHVLRAVFSIGVPQNLQRLSRRPSISRTCPRDRRWTPNRQAILPATCLII